MHPAKHDWPESDLARLRVMWADGLSLNQIGMALGLSRNAIAGKALRMGLDRRGTPIPPTKRSPDAVAKVKAMRAAGKSYSAIAEVLGVTTATARCWATRRQEPPKIRLHGATGHGPGIGMADMTRSMCRWPLWGRELPTFRCCGDPTAAGLPYCTTHAERAYKPQPVATDGRKAA